MADFRTQNASWARPVPFAAVWDRAVAGRADETFLVFETPSGSVIRWSYGDFDQVVDRGRLSRWGPSRARPCIWP